MSMTLKTEGERGIVVTRRFAASPELVYRAHMEPELIKRWLLGPEGWTMPVCINEARPGGRVRYEWAHPKRPGFSIEGRILELEPFHRIVHVERMFLPDPTPENNVVTEFTPEGDGSLMTMRMTLPDTEARNQMLASGMEKGMEVSYVRLDGLVAAGEIAAARV